MYPGIVAATVGLVIVFPSPGWPIATYVALAALACAIPTFFQPYIQRRYYKIPARFLLGIGFGLVAGALFLVPNTLLGWAVRALVFLSTVMLARVALAQRKRRLNDPCIGCPWGAFPLCVHNLPAMRRVRQTTGPDPFLDNLIAELEPLEPYPPKMGEAPPVARPGNFDFHASMPIQPK